MNSNPVKKILFLADINSPHTQKWASALASSGFRMGIFSLTSPANDWYTEMGITVFHKIRFRKHIFKLNDIIKITYLNSFGECKDAISEFQPDILHAHYATSYGMLARLSGFHPFLISVWGSDVLDFPNRSFLHKWFLKKNLLAADQILSTSNMLHDEVWKIAQRDSAIIPFGIDVNRFKPESEKKLFWEDCLVIGTIKSLEKHYCIDILIQAFAVLYRKYPMIKLRLLIVGEGTEEFKLKRLVSECGLDDVVLFKGRIQYDDIAGYHHTIDIFANLSEYESFGVSVLEASACGKPVVATETGGLLEVVKKDKSGFFVPVKDVQATAAALEKLVLNEQLRTSMGKEGREFVMKHYTFEESLKKMLQVYQQILK